MPTALVRNAHVVTAAETYDADLFVEHGRIALIGQGLSLPADTVLDASGLLVLPGGVDVHTHLDMPAGPLHVRRRLRDRHPGRRLWRHDHDRRLRDT